MNISNIKCSTSKIHVNLISNSNNWEMFTTQKYPVAKPTVNQSDVCAPLHTVL